MLLCEENHRLGSGSKKTCADERDGETSFAKMILQSDNEGESKRRSFNKRHKKISTYEVERATISSNFSSTVSSFWVSIS